MAESLETLNAAWNELTNILDPCICETKIISDLNEGLRCRDAFQIFTSRYPQKLITAWFLEKLKQRLQDYVVPQFWNYFKSDCNVAMSNFERFNSAVVFLYEAVRKWFKPVQLIDEMCSSSNSGKELNGKPFIDTFKLTYKSILFSQISLDFEAVVLDFYTSSLNAYLQKSYADVVPNTQEDEEGLMCKGCHKDAESCLCPSILQNFNFVNEKLSELELLERIAGESLTTATHHHIENHVHKICKGNFETLYLDSLENWLDTVLVGWLKIVFKGKDNDHTKIAIESCRARLIHFLYDTYALSRMEEMFNIIIEFPDSQSALEDLRSCLNKTNLRSKLIQTLKTTLETRLLHPGVNTSDILSAFTSTVKALWVLDPTGVLLELVCQPVHKYLRTRQDTVRCIVSSLTDDSSVELADEFSKGEPLVLDDTCLSDYDDESWENWKPDPIDANPEKILKSKRTSDIISMLVNIYGSKDLFVKEYRSLLADRVVTHFKYDIQKELRYLELLKLRFGEANLHICEVMLKDVVDSKRINTHIHSQETKMDSCENIPVSSFILSAQFWPQLREERLELHPNVKEAMDQYTKSFEKFKGNRTLVWKSHLGFVNLEIELKDRTLNLKVSPIHATIMLYFEEKDQWALDELGSVLQVPPTLLKRKLSFWISKGVIKEESPNNYVLIEDQGGKHQDFLMTDDDDETESAMASSHEQREEELQVYWSYIVGMLTNLEALPLERIHNTLKMFAVQSPTAMECSIQELKVFLERKVKENKLIYSTGTYRLPKATTS